MAEPEEPNVRSLLSRFGGGRVALLAVRKAIASSSNRRTSRDGVAAGPDGADAVPLVTHSGSSFSHRSPIAVPQQLEVEYSQASQQSQQSLPCCDEEAGQQAASWEAPGMLEGAGPHTGAGGITPCGSPSPGAPAGVSPSLGSQGTSASLQGGQCESPDEALLLCSALNAMAGEGLESLGANPRKSPLAVRLRREVERELSGTALCSPMVATMVSEHSFEEAEPLQAFGSSRSLPDASANTPLKRAAGSPNLARPTWPPPAAELAASGSRNRPASHDGQTAEAEEEPADMLFDSNRLGGSKRKPLHRAVTPLIAALGEERPIRSSGAPRATGTDEGRQERGPTGCKPRQQSRRGSRQMAQPVAGGQHAIKQQTWSFEDIPQGHTTIPSSHLPPELPSPGSKPKHKPRAGASGAAAAAAATCAEERASVQGLSRRSSGSAGPRAGTSSKAAGWAQGSTASVSAASSAAFLGLTRGGSQRQGPARLGTAWSSAQQAKGGRRANGKHAPGEAMFIEAADALQTVDGPCAQDEAAAAPALPLQQGISSGQAHAANAAYHHDRFVEHLNRLTQLMARRVQKRQQAQNALIARVSGFEESVRAQQLSSCSAGSDQQLQHRRQEEEAGPLTLEPEEWGFEARTLAKWKVAGRSSSPAAPASSTEASAAICPRGGALGLAAQPTQHEEAGKGGNKDEGSLMMGGSHRLRAVLARRQQQGWAQPATQQGDGDPESAPLQQPSIEAVPAASCAANGEKPPVQPDAQPGQDTATAAESVAVLAVPQGVATAGAAAAGCAEPAGFHELLAARAVADFATGEPQPHTREPATGSPGAAAEAWVGCLASGSSHPSAPAQLASPAAVLSMASGPGTDGPVQRLKPIMQVKGEQDLALKYLSSQQRRFRANPLPLSGAEPRLAEMTQRAQQQRAHAHVERLELLRSSERPFSFYGRDKQRQQAALAAAAAASESGCLAGLGCRTCPETPPAFLATPVPVSTTEARYALLVAEMQLQKRTVKGRSMVPRPRAGAGATAAAFRPATARTAHRMHREPPPPRPASSQAGGPSVAAPRPCMGSCGTSASALSMEAAGSESAEEASHVLSDPASSSRSTGSLDPGQSCTARLFGSFGTAGPASCCGGSFGLAGGAVNPLWEAAELIAKGPAAASAQAAGATEAVSVAACSSVVPSGGSQMGGGMQGDVVEGKEGGAAVQLEKRSEPDGAAELAGQELFDAALSGTDAYSSGFEMERGQVQELTPDFAAVTAGGGAVNDSTQQLAQMEPVPVELEPAQEDSLIRGPSSSSSSRASDHSSARAGTTRNHQLKLRAAQEGMASGRYATGPERASATEQDLKDMALLRSSPKWQAIATGAGTGNRTCSRGGSGGRLGCGTEGMEGLASAAASEGAGPCRRPHSATARRASAMTDSQLEAGAAGAIGASAGKAEGDQQAAQSAHTVVHASAEDLPGNGPAGIGAAGPVASGEAGSYPGPVTALPSTEGAGSVEAVVVGSNGAERESEGSEYGIAVPVPKEGLCGMRGSDGCDSPQIGALLLPAQSSSANSLGVSRRLGSLRAAAGGAASGGGSVRGDIESEAKVEEERRDTPLPHVLARHKQAEAAARNEVRKALIKRGMATHNFVVEGSQG